MIFGNDNFTFKPADFYPFKDQEDLERVRKLTYEDLVKMNGKHPTVKNMNFKVVNDDDVETILVADIVKRIVDSGRYDKKCVMIMPNPGPEYRKVAYILRQLGTNCRNVKFYMFA